MLRQGLPLLLLALLSGCNGATVRPDAPAPETATEAAAAETQAPAEQPKAVAQAGGDGGALAPQLEQLVNRLTLVQEQLIQLKAQGAELSQQSQQLLARLQMLTGPDVETADAPAAPPARAAAGTSAGALEGLIDQLGMIANQLSLGDAGDAFRLVAEYTRSGQWVLIRYDRFSGAAWLADQGIWQPLQDAQPVPSSDYEVVLQRADNDIKGYVAARIDRRSGATWWLKQDTWQSFD